MALALTDCGSSGSQTGDDRHPSSSYHPLTAPPTSSPTDPHAAEKKEVLQSYSRFWEEQIKAYAKASLENTSLTKYATGDALARAEGDLMSLKKAGNVMEGRPINNPKVAVFSTQNHTSKAKVTDCIDVSRWHVVNTKTGKTDPPPRGQLTRYVANVAAEKWGKQWMVLKVSLQERTC
ncbi:hypothetical protein [Streptomyces luteireticuli]|uniref:hypothetical protein n=1 Tax=Streptomyces luteireticuli TaxID=173858 RepID=UPI003556ABA8